MKHYLSAMRVALLLLLSFPLYVYADKKPSLRELFEGTNSSRMQIQAATDDVTVIDLEEWENEYDETLTIGNGKKYKFTNGKLKWIGTSDSAPLIVVSNGSSIEIAEGATFSTNCCNDLIQMKGGEVILNGGKLYPICGKLHVQFAEVPVYYAKSSPATNAVDIRRVRGFAINMVSGNNYFRLNSGYIDGDIYSQAEQSSSFLLLNYGTIQHDIVAYKDIYINRPEGQSSSWRIVLKDDAVAKIRKGGNELTFSVNDMQPGRVLAVGYDYHITESDLAKMHISGTNADNLKLSLENNQVVLRERFSTDEDDLQTRINAAVGNSSFENLKKILIPEEGIELTKTLEVPEGAYVNLVGGKLIKNSKGPYDKYAITISDNATLRLDDMNFVNNISLPCFNNRGNLVFGNNMTFDVVVSPSNFEFMYNYGRFDMYSGNISGGSKGIAIGGYGTVGTVNIYGGVVAGEIMSEYVYIHGGHIHGNITSYTYTQNEGSSELNTLNVRNMTINGGSLYISKGFQNLESARLLGGWMNCVNQMCSAKKMQIGSIEYFGDLNFTFVPDGNDHSTNVIEIEAPLTFDLKVNSDWQNYDFSKKPIVCRGIIAYPLPVYIGAKSVAASSLYVYDITQSDFDHITFVNLPEKVKASISNDYSPNAIILSARPSLQKLFDDLPKGGTEENPDAVFPNGDDDIDVDDPNDGKPDLHVLFGDESNDIPEGTEPKNTLHFHFDGEYGLIVPKTSSYEFKNINIDLDNHNIKHVIYVDGTLIINVNVYFLNITEYVKHVIYIRKGGRVIFRGGRHYIPGVVIYNEGGTIIYEGGDSRGGTYGVDNLGGTVTVSGGTIGGFDNGIRNTGGGTVTITGGHIYGGGTVDGGTPGGNTAGAGHVIYNDGNSRVNILGGDFDDNSSVWSEGKLWLDGSVNIRDFYIRNITVNIVSRITVDWYFYFIDGVDINYSIPLFKGDGYTLTEEDLSRIHIILPDGYRLVLDENNQIVIRSTNEIYSENDLQAKINATVGNSSPDALTEIKIAENGIELTKALYVPEGAHVNLVGGKLSVKKGYGNISHIVSIAENATLRMDNVTLELYYVEEVCESMFLNIGHLIFGEGMKIDRDEYCSFKSAFIVNYGTFDMYSGSISGRYYDLGINGSTDRGTVNVYGGRVMYGITNSAVNLYGGSIVGGTVKANTFVQKGGMAEVGINTVNCTIYDGSVYPLGELRAAESAKLYGGSISGGKIFARDMVIGDIDCYGMNFTFIPDGNDHSQNVITLTAPLKDNIKVTSDWKNYDFSKKPVVCRGLGFSIVEIITPPLLGNVDELRPEKLPYYYAKSVAAASASGYEITQSDLDHITFVDLPEKVRASISNDNAIILSRKGSLIDLFTDLPEGGSEEKPNNVIPDDVDDVEVDKPDPGKPNLHLIFGDDNNDTPDGVKPVKSLQYFFDGEYGMTIHKTSSYEFKNINIDLGSHSIDHVFYVDGTLIINVNVYFINITENVKHVIYIRKGGRVIFRGGKHYMPGVVIYNDGGTIIYEGGDSYGGTHGLENNGGTVTVSGGTIGGNGYGIRNTGGGTVTITGGHIYGGGTVDGGTPGGSTADAGHVIYNDGNSRVNILGGDFDDNSSVWSEGKLWLDGSVNIRDFYIRRNITIYIVNHITIDWYFYFIDDVVIDCSIPLFKADGYILTEEDLNRIHITLPDGYRLVLDKTKNAIFIVDDNSADSIGDATENSAPKSIYSPSGMSLKAAQKGLNIIDGNKVLIK